MIDTSKPVVGRGFRLQWEPAQEAHVLLYPEGMVKLNSSAAAIMSRCDGQRTIGEIVADIEKTYGVMGLESDVAAFVDMARQKNWLE
jgi:pyrroloquinoline quinone biosynthesis protein D